MVTFVAVMMYDFLYCKIFVTTPKYHSFLGGVLYIICVPMDYKSLVACTWFLLGAVLVQFDVC